MAFDAPAAKTAPLLTASSWRSASWTSIASAKLASASFPSNWRCSTQARHAGSVSMSHQRKDSRSCSSVGVPSRCSLAEILEKIALIRWTGISSVLINPRHEPRLTQFAREAVRYTAQAFQQMRPARRRVILLDTLREMEATFTDAAIAMLGALMGRAHLQARKRLEQRVAVSGRKGRDRLIRIATVLETVSRAARAGEDIGAALRDIMPFDMLDADAAIIRRSAAPHGDDVLSEIAAEYRIFKRAGAAAFDEGQGQHRLDRGAGKFRSAMARFDSSASGDLGQQRIVAHELSVPSNRRAGRPAAVTAYGPADGRRFWRRCRPGIVVALSGVAP